MNGSSSSGRVSVEAAQAAVAVAAEANKFVYNFFSRCLLTGLGSQGLQTWAEKPEIPR